MIVTSRPFDDAGDVRLLTDLVSAATVSGPPYSSWHVGDVLWGMYRAMDFDPHLNIRLWLDEEQTLRGFTWYYAPQEVAWYLHPSIAGEDTIEEEMLAWGLARRHEFPTNAGETPTLTTTALESDDRRIAFLKRHDFQGATSHLVHMVNDLSAPIPDEPPPDGLTIRHLDGESEFAARVALHREIWDPSKVTLESYTHMRMVRGYTPDLDLVAVTDDGKFVSYCICWLDAANGIGEFEPVGTRRPLRGRGYGRAVMLEGLRRLKERGASSAVVLSHGANDAAIKLYESVGFRIRDREYDYVKSLA